MSVAGAGGPPRVALLGQDGSSLLSERLSDAVRAGGGVISEVTTADAALVTSHATDEIHAALQVNPGLAWIGLPSAGIEDFHGVIDTARIWTSAKGAYGREVSEHALALLLGGMRGLVHYAGERRWGDPYGRSLIGGRITIVGGGDIARRLVALLTPFDVQITVVRRHPEPMDGVHTVRPTSDLLAALATADAVVLALALTPETFHLIDRRALDALPDHAWLVNVARGAHVDLDALLDAIREGRLAGAALDVTDPEPLPEGHPIWAEPRVIVTPHVANPPGNAPRRLADQVRENVRRFAAGEPLLGVIDPSLGY